MLIFLPFVAIFLSSLPARAEANILQGLKTLKPLRHFYPANCTVGNTTYAHGQTFKLDCKTQCVCENGRHACSSLCPKEQLPAPEDTISCRSPRLVEVPGHCCKMWLCENPTADVTATCHNSSTSPWTPCSHRCGIGFSTRITSTTQGCRKLSNVRLCENRACDQDNKDEEEQILINYHKELNSISQQLNLDFSHRQSKVIKDLSKNKDVAEHEVQEHRIRKGHECRHIQRLGPARIRLGPCVSKKLYRPKLCGRCQHRNKCCVPSLSTTIQVELLCPLKADDPISYVEQGHRQQQQQQQLLQHQEQQQQHDGERHHQQHLWNTISLEPIDQEFLQSHQIQIENKFLAVEWILKCECSRNENCNDKNYSYSNIKNNNNVSYFNSNKSNNITNADKHNTGDKQPQHRMSFAPKAADERDNKSSGYNNKSNNKNKYQQHYNSSNNNNRLDEQHQHHSNTART